MKLILPRGTTGFFNERNEWVCTGSQMGRRNQTADAEKDCKLHLRKLNLTDGGCYDSGGAYWGSPNNLYVAFTAHHVYSPVRSAMELLPSDIQIFVRADNRWAAKQGVRKLQPKARFYN